MLSFLGNWMKMVVQLPPFEISPFEMEIKYYYNNPNLNLNEILYKLNETTRKVCLRHSGRSSFE